MESTTTHIVVLITAGSKHEAEAIGKALVESRLAACVNILEHVWSLFRWQGVIERQEEVLMLVKSRSDLLPSIIQVVKEMHSYTVPEVIALPILAGSPDYLAWADESIRQTS
ncbi:dihydroorotate dehydrogenase [Candidatus Methylomirabilis lanthanidiphila]|uniref:Dihydroorotate dehydrogenase n=1 Tax=Candidatus Methylomirabilis lanthanidiphila TaxID=2211376 RepID=A0A564ZNF0_9BACT|nr:divalent-cation tolerance protein CutA [Candidatus Methylomirabilis lanthanidiphila]VUZ86182.1 dihydroorotate dehydrogenase [Candidatus Methylomirabilis lanthanidiphila]